MTQSPQLPVSTPKEVPRLAIDQQTGEPYEIELEGRNAAIVAGISAIYLMLVTGFLLWLLFDTWSGRNVLPVALGYDTAILASRSFRLLAFVAIGGALGAAVDGIRSNIAWHSQLGAYGPRFIWRDLSLPLIGAAVGLFAYVTVRSGAGVFNGDFSLDPKGGSTTVAGFAVAVLAGFSSLQVFRWLDTQANKLFSVATVSKTIVPNLRGRGVEDATAVLKNRKLILGDRTEVMDRDNAGKVVRQSPAPKTVVPEQTSVDITLATKNEANSTVAVVHPKPGQIGILAYGSLIDRPGDEIQDATQRIISAHVETPFPVEFARSSASRAGAPTLIPVDTGGKKVPARIFVLSPETSKQSAQDMLWRRETQTKDRNEHYDRPKSPGTNDVFVEEVTDQTWLRRHAVPLVFYTRIPANIAPLTVKTLADLAIKSACSPEVHKYNDGINYLIDAQRNGINTPLSKGYEAEIKERFHVQSLEEVREKIREKNHDEMREGNHEAASRQRDTDGW